MMHAHVHQLTRDMTDTNQRLRDLWQASGLTQEDALKKINHRQARPWAMSTFKAFMAAPESSRRRTCTAEFMERAEKVLTPTEKGS